MSNKVTYPPVIKSLIEKQSALNTLVESSSDELPEENKEQIIETMNIEEPVKTAAVVDNNEELLNVATHFRAMQFLAHNAHNLMGGANFFSDHEFFAESYAEYEDSYDRIIELVIGNGEKPNLVTLQEIAVGKLSSLTQEDHFNAVLTAEEQLQEAIEEFAKTGPSQAALNMFGDLAEKSKVRIYKIRQRLAA